MHLDCWTGRSLGGGRNGVPGCPKLRAAQQTGRTTELPRQETLPSEANSYLRRRRRIRQVPRIAREVASRGIRGERVTGQARSMGTTGKTAHGFFGEGVAPDARTNRHQGTAKQFVAPASSTGQTSTISVVHPRFPPSSHSARHVLPSIDRSVSDRTPATASCGRASAASPCTSPPASEHCVDLPQP